jgi:hypothetical protein
VCRDAHERDSETHGRDGRRSDPDSHGAWHTCLRISAPLRLPFLLAPSLGRSLFRQGSGIGGAQVCVRGACACASARIDAPALVWLCRVVNALCHVATLLGDRFKT